MPEDMPDEAIVSEDSVETPHDPSGTHASAEAAGEVPEKFLDSETGAVRTDALARSYRELERKLSERTAQRETATGDRPVPDAVPESPDGYALDMLHPAVAPDDEVNAMLHDAGFTQAQAQLVYDLAALRVAPMLEQMAADYAAREGERRLVEHFGGEERWHEAARQIESWAAASLPEELYALLAAHPEGVIAMHRMMGSGEVPMIRGGEAGSGPSEAQLRKLMQDPRYWRDHDPEIVDRVRRGFEALYPGRAGA